jgi:transcriptional regulator with XRE-family HTH domain
MQRETFHDRLRLVVGKRSNREVGEITGCHPETVRRYLTGQAPSVEFVRLLAEKTNTDVGWLVSGRAQPVDPAKLSTEVEQLANRLAAVEGQLRSLLAERVEATSREQPKAVNMSIFPDSSLRAASLTS